MSETIIVEPTVNSITNLQSVSLAVTEPVVNAVTVTEENKVVIVSAVGIEGPAGINGADGAPGISGGSYTYEQQTPSSSWTINHSLGYRPAVYVQDYGNNTLECDIHHTSVNQVVLTFLVNVTGYAYLT